MIQEKILKKRLLKKQFLKCQSFSLSYYNNIYPFINILSPIFKILHYKYKVPIIYYSTLVYSTTESFLLFTLIYLKKHICKKH